MNNITKQKWNCHYKKDKSILLYPDEQLVRLLNKFNYKKDTAIDIGCGSGRHIKLLSEYNFNNIYGIDISYNSVQLCKNLYKTNGFIQASNINLPIKSNCIDVTIAWGSLHYCPSDETKTMIDEIYRILKDDGIVFGTLRSINDTYLKRGKKISKNTWQTTLNELDGAIVSFFSYEEVKQLLSNFSNVNIGLMERTSINNIEQKISHWYFAATK